MPSWWLSWAGWGACRAQCWGACWWASSTISARRSSPSCPTSRSSRPWPPFSPSGPRGSSAARDPPPRAARRWRRRAPRPRGPLPARVPADARHPGPHRRHSRHEPRRAAGLYGHAAAGPCRLLGRGCLCGGAPRHRARRRPRGLSRRRRAARGGHRGRLRPRRHPRGRHLFPDDHARAGHGGLGSGLPLGLGHQGRQRRVRRAASEPAGPGPPRRAPALLLLRAGGGLPGLGAAGPARRLALRPPPARNPRERVAHAEPRLSRVAAQVSRLRAVRHRGGRGRRALGLLQRLRLAHRRAAHYLGGGPPHGSAGRSRLPGRLPAGRGRHRVPQELRQHLHQALAAHPGRRVHRRHPLRAPGRDGRAPGAATLALPLAGVSKSFGGLHAVEGVTLSVQAGERRALIGPNGAGKTTLFNLISGTLPLSGGAISLFGQDVTRAPAHRRAALGLARTFQITNLFPDLTVLENCLLAVQALSPVKFSMLRPVTAYGHLRESARAMLEAVGLEAVAAARVNVLSHGEQRQLEIALALAGRPRVLLLDEPTAGLSPAESRLMAALLARLHPALTLTMIEHDMDIALELSPTVTVLHYGRVIADGSREEIRADPQVREIYLGG